MPTVISEIPAQSRPNGLSDYTLGEKLLSKIPTNVVRAIGKAVRLLRSKKQDFTFPAVKVTTPDQAPIVFYAYQEQDKDGKLRFTFREGERGAGRRKSAERVVKTPVKSKKKVARKPKSS